MITKRDFIDFIAAIKKYESILDKMEDVLNTRGGLHESDFNIAVEELMSIFFDSHFTEEGCDMIYWWLYEDVKKIIYDEDKEINITDIEDFYDYLITHEYAKSDSE